MLTLHLLSTFPYLARLIAFPACSFSCGPVPFEIDNPCPSFTPPLSQLSIPNHLIMLFPSLTATVSLLLLTSSTLAAGGHEQGASRRSSTHARHRRLANQGSAVKRAVPIPGGIESDIHGRQAPGSIAMRKRSDGSFCKVRSSSSALPSASASIAIQNSTSVYVAVAAPEATSATSSGVDNSVAESYTAVASTSVTVVSSGTGSSTLSASLTTSSVAVSTESSTVSSVAQPASSSVVPTVCVDPLWSHFFFLFLFHFFLLLSLTQLKML